MWDFPLLPERASTIAGKIDLLLLFLVAVTVFFSVLIAVLIIYFAVKYRKGRRVNREQPPTFHLPLELIWTAIPLVIVMGIFIWATGLYLHVRSAPSNALEMYVVGKRWMWKIQHPEGHREINQLHVPTGTPVKLVMTSQDVIHNFSIPAFRTKQDVVPGRYSMEWFEATKPGTYHLYCSQYCGTSHAAMVGQVVVMDPAQYQSWVSGQSKGLASMSASGEQTFQKLGCATCHRTDSAIRAPLLKNLLGSTVKLKGGRTIKADETYIRESIVSPATKVVEGYDPIMPTFQGQVDEAAILELIAYIKSLQ